VTVALLFVSTTLNWLVSPTGSELGVKVMAPVGFAKLFTAKVAIAGVVLLIVGPLSLAENPAVEPPTVNPLDGPFAGIVVV
jgi:C4-dicarboxylate transporter